MRNVFFHNPRCSKSRTALALIEARGVTDLEIREYLKTPPSAEELAEIVGLLGARPVDLCRKGEQAFKDLGVGDGADVPDGEMIDQMIRNPIIIERPILVYGGRAAVGRPPETVLALLA
ncbi:MAG: arsenate reductase (glutaredoxin) [Myxococcota bacterium]